MARLASLTAQSEKQRALAALAALPEDATLDDAIERLLFIAKVEEGLRQSEAGALLSHDEVARRFQVPPS